MNILSLFDGISTGRFCLEECGIKVDNYIASEVDKYAIQVSKANWNDIKHIGDVRGIVITYSELLGITYMRNIISGERYSFKGKIDLIIAGSPCQGFSFAGKQLNFDDPRSALLFEFVDLLNDIRKHNPDVKFFLENVMMKQQFQDVISNLLSVKPIKLNSALVSAQNRKRLYWTNIPYFGAPEDRGILLKDILEDGSDTVLKWQNSKDGAVHSNTKSAALHAAPPSHGIRKSQQVLIPFVNQNGVQREVIKSTCIDANYFKGMDNHAQRTLIMGMAIRERYDENGKVVQGFEFNGEEKANSLTTVEKDSMIVKQINPALDAAGKQPYMQDRVYDVTGKSVALTAEFGGRLNAGVQNPNGYVYRKLTLTECERLQGMPDFYVQRITASGKPISATQAYKALGNGWQGDTITYLFQPLADADIL